jgi:hypothetical protein
VAKGSAQAQRFEPNAPPRPRLSPGRRGVRFSEMNRLAITLAMLAAAMLGGGCAMAPTLATSSASLLTPSGTSLDVHGGTLVKLDQPNFIVVRTNVVGRCKGFTLFGLFSIVPAKYTTAMNRLYSQAALQPGRSQTLAQIMVERSSTSLILFSFPEVAVRADVVEFVPESDLRPASPSASQLGTTSQERPPAPLPRE